MGVGTITYKDLQSFLRHGYAMPATGAGYAQPKNFKVTKAGSIYSNPGATGPMRDYFTLTTTQKEMDTLLRPLFQQYKARHPVPPMANMNPAAKKMTETAWLNRAVKWLEKEQKKDKPMNWKTIYGFPQDKTLRHGAKPASTWLKNIRVNGNTVYINLGNKEYEYGIKDAKAFQRFLQQPSLGAVIARLAAKGKGKRVVDPSGLIKLY